MVLQTFCACFVNAQCMRGMPEYSDPVLADRDCLHNSNARFVRRLPGAPGPRLHTAEPSLPSGMEAVGRPDEDVTIRRVGRNGTKDGHGSLGCSV